MQSNHLLHGTNIQSEIKGQWDSKDNPQKKFNQQQTLRYCLRQVYVSMESMKWQYQT